MPKTTIDDRIKKLQAQKDKQARIIAAKKLMEQARAALKKERTK